MDWWFKWDGLLKCECLLYSDIVILWYINPVIVWYIDASIPQGYSDLLIEVYCDTGKQWQ